MLVLTQEEMAGDLAGFIGKAVMFADATPRVAIPRRTAREAVSNPEFAYPILRRINISAPIPPRRSRCSISVRPRRSYIAAWASSPLTPCAGGSGTIVR